MGKKLFSVMAVVMASTFALTACGSTTDAIDTASVSPGGEVERGALETDPALVAIVNNTGSNITLSISGTDNYDWEGSRPDHPAPEGFQGTVIAPGETQTRSLTGNNHSNGQPFTINFGVTGASVELSTANRCSTWNLRVAITSCYMNVVKSAGYTITVDTVWGPPEKATVTITK